MEYAHRVTGVSTRPRGQNLLDTGAHFYEVYETSEGGQVAVGAIEPKFYGLLIRLLGLEHTDLPQQMDRAAWAAMKRQFADIFATRTRDEWATIFMGSDACVVPVLSLDEAPLHPHNASRQTFTEVGGVVQPAPAPRFSRTPGSIRRPPPHPGQGADEVLTEWGLDSSEIEELRGCGAVR
jgi:alpha-methylacyl-CoA racemase